MSKIVEWFNRVMLASTPREPAEFDDGVRLFEFRAWPKTTRYFRDIVVSEKLDGTNGALHIADVTDSDWHADDSVIALAEVNGRVFAVGAQSRNRIINLAADNQGFARWVLDNVSTLVEDLGPGLHYGEFWGQGIGRKYGLTEKRFSLFNPSFGFGEYFHPSPSPDGTYQIKTPGLTTVPVLYSGPHSTEAIRRTLADLRDFGSLAAPGFMRPEGVVIYHTHAHKIIGKVTLDSQDAGKWETA